MPLAGGIANLGYQCGMLWGAALAAGARAHQLYGSGPKAETAALAASQRLVKTFHGHSKNEINCLEISDLNMQGEIDAKSIFKFFIKVGPMGLSGLHQVMAAGFAGGIGFSGGGCGALGAAIWIKGLEEPVEVEGFSYSGTWVNEKIEEFLELSDYEFECSAITGRKFENVADHADFIKSGGCSKIIAGLVS